MTAWTAAGFGFFIGWLAAWSLFALIVWWSRGHRPPPDPIRTAQVDHLYRVLYGRDRVDHDKRRMH